LSGLYGPVDPEAEADVFEEAVNGMHDACLITTAEGYLQSVIRSDDAKGEGTVGQVSIDPEGGLDAAGYHPEM
jgi:hypothetical protein